MVSELAESDLSRVHRRFQVHWPGFFCGCTFGLTRRMWRRKFGIALFHLPFFSTMLPLLVFFATEIMNFAYPDGACVPTAAPGFVHRM